MYDHVGYMNDFHDGKIMITYTGQLTFNGTGPK